MKKILHILVLLCITTTVSFAQQQSREVRNQETRAAQRVTSEKMNLIKHHKDLDDQMTKLFGENYASMEIKVIEQLKKNIADKNTPVSIRKNSLFVIYGDDYLKHADGILNTSQLKQ